VTLSFPGKARQGRDLENAQSQVEGMGPFDEPDDFLNRTDESEVDEIEEEMSNGVAKTWGQFTKALNNALLENLGEDIAHQEHLMLSHQ